MRATIPCVSTVAVPFVLQVYEEGTHLMIPWFERPIIYDVRARPNVIQSQSGSRDLQMVVLFRTPVKSIDGEMLYLLCVRASTAVCVSILHG